MSEPGLDAQPRTTSFMNMNMNMKNKASAAASRGAKFTSSTVSYFIGLTKLVTETVMTNKLIVLVIASMIVYVVISGVVMANDTAATFADMVWQTGGSGPDVDIKGTGYTDVLTKVAMFFGFLFISIVLILLVRLKTKSGLTGTTNTMGDEIKYVSQNYGSAGFALFIVMFIVLFFVMYDYLGVQYPTITGALNSTFLILIAVGGIAILTMLTKGSFAKIGEYDSSPTFVNIFKRAVFFVPCMFVDLANYIYSEYKITPSPTFALIGIELILIATYFLLPNFQKIYMDLVLHDGQDIVTERMYLDSETIVDVEKASFQDKDPDDGDGNVVSYNYALSSWIYVMDSRGSNSYKTLLSYGNKPLIQYNDKTHMLKVSCETWSGGDGVDGGTRNQSIVELYKTHTIPVQAWSQIVINFSGGVLDVFINAELVCSTTGVIPGDYETVDTIVVGDTNGIQGEITDVTYFSHELSVGSIKNMYSLNRDRVGKEDRSWWKFV